MSVDQVLGGATSCLRAGIVPHRWRRAVRAGGVLVRALVLAALLPFGGYAVAAEPPPTQSEIETGLTCQCGCGLTVHSCNHVNCPSGIPLKAEIAEQLAAGMSREEIFSYFEQKYGEKILSAPTMRGFNLAAWIMPFVVIGVGLLIVALVLLRWRRQTAALPDHSTALGREASELADPAARARLDEALRGFDERS